jgi:hypothetical protein
VGKSLHQYLGVIGVVRLHLDLGDQLQ